MKIILNKLDDILTYIKSNNPSRYVGINEVSKISGLSCSTLRRYVKAQKLKASDSTGKLLFKVSDVENWLNG